MPYGLYVKTSEDADERTWSVRGVFSTPEEAGGMVAKILKEDAFLRVEVAKLERVLDKPLARARCAYEQPAKDERYPVLCDRDHRYARREYCDKHCKKRSA